MVKIICLVVLLLMITFFNDIDSGTPRRRRQRRLKYYRTRRPKSKRIIDGTPAVDEQWPFAVSIQHKGDHMCGGSIIAERWVLTACHCYVEEDDTIVRENELTVTVGSVLWRNGMTHKVERLVMHEKYDNDAVVDDIALLKVKKPFSFSSKVKSIKPSPHNIDDERDDVQATVIGWGFTNFGRYLVSKASERLNYVQVRVIAWYKCIDFYTDIYPTNLCVTSGTMKGSCNGDSGGPLVTYTEQGLVQIGLLSYGDDCNNTKPEVYTRVPLFLNWIKDHMN